jgi:hypothetical protein
MDCPSKIEAIVAIDLGFQVVSALINGDTVTIDPVMVLDSIRQMIEPMVKIAA